MVRHVLITVRTMASQSGEMLHARCTRVLKRLPEADRRSSRTCATGTGGWTGSPPASWTSSTGVTDFYRARTDTRMTIAAERLAVIAAVTLPVAAISSVFGHERHRQRPHALDLPGDRRRHHGGDVALAAALGEAAGLVVAGPTDRGRLCDLGHIRPGSPKRGGAHEAPSTGHVQRERPLVPHHRLGASTATAAPRDRERQNDKHEHPGQGGARRHRDGAVGGRWRRDGLRDPLPGPGAARQHPGWRLRGRDDARRGRRDGQ